MGPIRIPFPIFIFERLAPLDWTRSYRLLSDAHLRDLAGTFILVRPQGVAVLEASPVPSQQLLGAQLPVGGSIVSARSVGAPPS